MTSKTQFNIEDFNPSIDDFVKVEPKKTKIEKSEIPVMVQSVGKGKKGKIVVEANPSIVDEKLANDDIIYKQQKLDKIF